MKYVANFLCDKFVYSIFGSYIIGKIYSKYRRSNNKCVKLILEFLLSDESRTTYDKDL